jgi:2-oxoglutarate dehydrogenase E2 component (dihydrolipoamide succinyltransferase)
MPVELVVPSLGESITEVEIGAWLVNPGDAVTTDQPLVEIESDKATVELPSPASGTLKEVLKQTGDVVNVGDVIGFLEEGEAHSTSPTPAEKQAETIEKESPEPTIEPESTAKQPETRVMPAAARALDEYDLKASQVEPSGPGGRLLKEDVQRHASKSPAPAPVSRDGGPRETETVRMSPMRRSVARRLVEAQQEAALLTTFNEIDMSGVKTLRAEFQEDFQKRYGIKLGYMSFFVKACIDALKQQPQVNGQIEGDNIVYHNYYDIGVAVGGGKGLVVPVLRNAERMSFAEVELAIADFGRRAQENKVAIEELQGGTFTISNGGVYGSLLSTPIINPPQSGVLGMHAIQDRPIALDGQVVIRPMMYVALTYDHRIVDGREAVTFLKRIKECIENPSRMLVEV